MSKENIKTFFKVILILLPFSLLIIYLSTEFSKKKIVEEGIYLEKTEAVLSATHQISKMLTALPTATITSTPTPFCVQKVNNKYKEIPILQYPGTDVIGVINTEFEGSITIIGKEADDNGWYQVRYEDQNGWIQGDFLDQENLCYEIDVLRELSLQEIYSIEDEDERVLLSDTFSNKISNIWEDVSYSREYSTKMYREDQVLNIDTERFVSTEVLQNLEDFKLVVVYDVEGNTNDKKAFVRYVITDSNDNWLEIKLTSECDVVVNQTNEDYPLIQYDLDSNKCHDNIFNNFSFRLVEDQLIVELNGEEVGVVLKELLKKPYLINIQQNKYSSLLYSHVYVSEIEDM